MWRRKNIDDDKGDNDNDEEKNYYQKDKKKKNVTAPKDLVSLRATQALKACHLSSICAEIGYQRCKDTGRIPRGVIQKVLNANKAIYTWLMIDLIKKALMTFKCAVTGSLETISDLTDASMADNVGQSAINVLPPSTIGFESETQKKKAGCPKGSSVQSA
jgi:hypothetical protein